MAGALTRYTKSANLPTLSDQELAAQAEGALDDTGSGSAGDVNYLNFSGKSGLYSLGVNKVEVDPDALFILEPTSFGKGWIYWKSAKVLRRVNWSVFKDRDNAVLESELEDLGKPKTDKDGWKFQLILGFISTDGKATSVEFANNSKSGVNSMKTLMDETLERMRDGEPSMAVLRFRSESFTAKDYDNYKPTFEIEAWVTRPSVQSFFDQKMELGELLSGKLPRKKAASKKKAPAKAKGGKAKGRKAA